MVNNNWFIKKKFEFCILFVTYQLLTLKFCPALEIIKSSIQDSVKKMTVILLTEGTETQLKGLLPVYIFIYRLFLS